MNIRTIRINSGHPDHEQGFYIINESDFDEKIHERWAEDADAEAIRAAEAKRAEVIEAKRAEALKAAAYAREAAERGKVVLQPTADEQKAAYAAKREREANR